MLTRKLMCLYPTGNYSYQENADYTMDFSTGVLPQQSNFFRNSAGMEKATGIVNGRVTEFPAGAPRFCDEGLLLESYTVNYFTDPRLENAKYNVGSTTPFNNYQANTGWTITVMARGTENGIPYMDVRFQRTAVAGTGYQWTMQDPLIIPINAGGVSTPQTFIYSMYTKLVGGAITNITFLRLGWQQFLADGITPATGGGNIAIASLDINLVNNTNPLLMNRKIGATVSSNVAGATIAPTIGFTVVTNLAVDITLRIGGIQFESQGVNANVTPTAARETGYASSLCWPPVGSPQISNRAADFLICPAMKNSLSAKEQSAIVDATAFNNALASGGTYSFIGIDDGSNSNTSMRMNQANGTFRSVTWNNAVRYVNIPSPAPWPLTTSQIIVGGANKEGAASFAVNGVIQTPNVGTTDNFPGGNVARITVCDLNVYEAPKSFIKRVRVWNHLLSDADLIDYTTLPVWQWKFFGSEGPLPAVITYTRAGTTYGQYDYKLNTLAANTPVVGNTVIHLDPPSTNGVRNARLEGGTVGTSTLPTNCALLNNAVGATVTLVGQGIDSNGWPYADIRIQKTNSTSSGAFRLAFEAANIVTVAPGEAWTTSLYMQRIAGSWNGTDASGLYFNVGALTFTSANAVVNSGAEQQYQFTQFEVPLGQFRTQSIFNAASTAAYLRPTIAWNSNNNTTYDITLRISCVQAEKLPFASQPMLPVAGTPAASSRSAQTAIISPISGISYSATAGSFVVEFLSNMGPSSAIIGNGNLLTLNIAATPVSQLNLYIDYTTLKICLVVKNSGINAFAPIVLGDALIYGSRINRVAFSYQNLGGSNMTITAMANSNLPVTVTFTSAVFASFDSLVLINSALGYLTAAMGLRRLKYYNKALSVNSLQVEGNIVS